MKHIRTICMMLALMISFVFSSCGNSTAPDNNSSNTSVPSSDSENIETEEIEGPSFIAVETVKEKLEPAIFYSNGWTLWHPGESEYIYAETYGLIVRYNISNNTIDRAVDMLGLYKEFPGGFLEFSFDGAYALAYMISDRFPEEKRYIYLLDFENCEVTFSSYKEKIQLGGFYYENVDRLDYIIKLEDRGYVAYNRNDTSLVHEITVLRGGVIDNENYGVGITGEIMCTLEPPEDGFQLGYYKFVLINIPENKIIQECPINTK